MATREVESLAVFGWFSRKKRSGEAPKDPIAAFDSVIQSLERQGAEVRKSAATLLALRAELGRDEKRYGARDDELATRIATASHEGDPHVERVLLRDREDARRMLEKTREALANAETNATLLLEVAESLGREVAELKAERQSARARLSAGVEVTEALRTRAAEFERVMKLDAARDEIERAQALADLYREDAAKAR
jgi:phage shock protein A